MAALQCCVCIYCLTTDQWARASCTSLLWHLGKSLRHIVNSSHLILLYSCTLCFQTHFKLLFWRYVYANCNLAKLLSYAANLGSRHYRPPPHPKKLLWNNFHVTKDLQRRFELLTHPIRVSRCKYWDTEDILETFVSKCVKLNAARASYR
jgi:hypothetical protein